MKETINGIRTFFAGAKGRFLRFCGGVPPFYVLMAAMIPAVICGARCVCARLRNGRTAKHWAGNCPKRR